MMEEYRIRNIEQLKSLWQDIYSAQGRVDWSGMLPYYAEDIRFKDSVQYIKGKRRFAAMTRRLARRSKNLRFIIHNATMEGHLAFVEWEMVISYKRFPSSSVFGASRLLLRDGKIAEQRDYYDLWGDIFDNIPFFSKAYRVFMRRSFG
jgi:ketosteroid isomerase-like protein